MATRQRKTPRQRAEEALALAQRKVTRALEKEAAAEVELRTATAERQEAQRRLAYTEQDPALQDQTLDGDQPAETTHPEE